MNKNKASFLVLSMVFMLVSPLVYFLPSPNNLIAFIVPLSVIAAVSFFRFNSFLAEKSALETFLSWFIANVGFDVLYVVNYVFNLGILRQRYGFYSDMAGAEIIIIIAPALLILNAVTLVYVFIKRKRVNH